MRIPSLREVTDAVGYSAGKLRLRLSRIRWASKFLHIVVAIAPFVVVNLAVFTSGYFKDIPYWSILVLVSIGFALLSAAAFSAVLFSFLMLLLRPDTAIARRIQTMLDHAAHPLHVINHSAADSSKEQQQGSFTAYDEERAFYQEQLEELQRNGLLVGMDLEDLMKEGHNADIDISAIRGKSIGV